MADVRSEDDCFVRYVVTYGCAAVEAQAGQFDLYLVIFELRVMRDILRRITYDCVCGGRRISGQPYVRGCLVNPFPAPGYGRGLDMSTCRTRPASAPRRRPAVT